MKDIIIVGAGIAGLSAAHHLKKKGYEPIVLEAQSQIGGRTQTDRSLGVAFDKGASWIHGPTGNPITTLAQQAGIQIFLTNDENVKVYDQDGIIYDDVILGRAEVQYEQILEEMRGRKKKSFAEVFYQDYPQYKNDRLWTYMLSAYLEFDTGGDIYQLASKGFYDDEEFDGADVIITNGYDRLADYLAQDLDIRLNTQVTEIDYSGERIAVQTNQGSYSADIVLVAVPLGVLKRSIIQFIPALPKRTQKAIQRLGMGTVNKFLFVWDEIFWDADVQYIGYTPEERGKFNYFLNMTRYLNDAALMTFAYGDYAVTTEQMTDEEITEAVMSHLRNIYGSNIHHPKQMLRTQWNQNPYTYGSYSFAAKGSGSDPYEVFEKPVDKKVFFAGEHTIADYRATVHGAYLSGIREAKKMRKVK
ncbi:MAG: NAD(P)/FAD-dependent oxidoreductase [Bacteroidota bacterium]